MYRTPYTLHARVPRPPLHPAQASVRRIVAPSDGPCGVPTVTCQSYACQPPVTACRRCLRHGRAHAPSSSICHSSVARVSAARGPHRPHQMPRQLRGTPPAPPRLPALPVRRRACSLRRHGATPARSVASKVLAPERRVELRHEARLARLWQLLKPSVRERLLRGDALRRVPAQHSLNEVVARL